MAVPGIRAEIDLVELEKLCALHCTDRELADWFGVTTRTIERRRKEPEFAAVMDRGRSKGKINLRRAQMRLLEKGNATMAIWLGKQWLGQEDHVLNTEDRRQVMVLYPPMSAVRPAPEDDGVVTLDVRQIED